MQMQMQMHASWMSLVRNELSRSRPQRTADGQSINSRPNAEIRSALVH